jgi:hypothetical protein
MAVRALRGRLRRSREEIPHSNAESNPCVIGQMAGLLLLGKSQCGTVGEGQQLLPPDRMLKPNLPQIR